jgi:hypothetical protein
MKIELSKKRKIITTIVSVFYILMLLAEGELSMGGVLQITFASFAIIGILFLWVK